MTRASILCSILTAVAVGFSSLAAVTAAGVAEDRLGDVRPLRIAAEPSSVAINDRLPSALSTRGPTFEEVDFRPGWWRFVTIIIRIVKGTTRISTMTAERAIRIAANAEQRISTRSIRIVGGATRVVHHPAREIPKTAQRFRAWLRDRPWDEIVLIEAISEGGQWLVFRGGTAEPVGVFEIENDSVDEQVESLRAIYDELDDRQSSLDGVSDRRSWQALATAHAQLVHDLEEEMGQCLDIGRFRAAG